jgi:hypothetical protein
MFTVQTCRNFGETFPSSSVNGFDGVKHADAAELRRQICDRSMGGRFRLKLLRFLPRAKSARAKGFCLGKPAIAFCWGRQCQLN